MKLFLALAAALATVQGQFKDPFLNRLHKTKVKFFKDRMGQATWDGFQETLHSDLVNVLYFPLRLADYWPFMLLDENPGVDLVTDRSGVQQVLDRRDGRKCREIDSCRLAGAADQCLMFLTGQQGSCATNSVIPDCGNSDQLYSCHKIPSDFMGQKDRTFNEGYIVSSFRRQFPSLPFESVRNGTKFVLFRTGAKQPTTMDLEQLLSMLFHLDDDASPRQLDFWTGMQSLQQLAENVAVMIGDSVMNLQGNLEQIGSGLMGDRVPIGIVASSPTQPPTFVHSQHFTSDPDKAIQELEDQELLDQLNVALEVMATDDHWNSDLADAAHLDHLTLDQMLHTPIKQVSSPLEAHYDGSGVTHYDIHPIVSAKKQELRRRILYRMENGDMRSLAQRIETRVARNGGWQSILEPIQSKARGDDGQLFELSPTLKSFLVKLEAKDVDKATCQCLERDELGTMLGVDSDTLEYVYSQMCVDPVPWCYVSVQQSDCADQTSSRINLKNSEIAWSQMACSTFKLENQYDVYMEAGQKRSIQEWANFKLNLFMDVKNTIMSYFEASAPLAAQQRTCRLLPRANHMDHNCFDMDTNYLGPCRGRFATDVPCTIEDIRSSAMGQNSDYVKIIESTYKFENTDIMTSSSSWPWNEAHLKEDDGATTCHCLDHDELDAMLGVDSDTLEYIYSQMCVQPVPWCFVSAQESDCADQTSSRIRLKNSEIAWSQIACSTFKLPSFWSKKPGHF